MMAETQHTQTHPKFTSLDKSGGQKPLDFRGLGFSPASSAFNAA